MNNASPLTYTYKAFIFRRSVVVRIITIKPSQKNILDTIVRLHVTAFKGFFLSSLHKGFLRQLYRSFIEHESSGLLVAVEDDDTAVGFLAYSWDSRDFYRFMLRRHLISFVWYSFLSFLRKPSIFAKMFGALGMPSKSVRNENYVKIFSIAVDPEYQHQNVGSLLMQDLKNRVDFNKYTYITLETDADDNDYANSFYQKNGLVLSSRYILLFSTRTRLM